MIVPALTFVLMVAGYLLGSLSCAILVSKLMGLPDPRSQGSRNPGATNVLRLAGYKPALLVLAGDMLKGVPTLLIAHALHLPPMAFVGIALAAFLGHLYPAYFDFQGGKGVATFLGVLLGLHWITGLAAMATWIVLALLFRLSSLAALGAAFMAPLYLHWLGAPLQFVAVAVIMSTFLVWRHRVNIHNLLHGGEPKINFKRTSTS